MESAYPEYEKFFKEKGAIELYQVLANITQLSIEGHQAFRLKASTIRQKIMFASRRSDNEIIYSEDSVQKPFLHVFETSSLRSLVKMKSHLKVTRLLSAMLMRAGKENGWLM